MRIRTDCVEDFLTNQAPGTPLGAEFFRGAALAIQRDVIDTCRHYLGPWTCDYCDVSNEAALSCKKCGAPREGVELDRQEGSR